MSAAGGCTLREKLSRYFVVRLSCAAFIVALVALFSSCAVDQTRSGLPSEAQAAIDRVTENIAAGHGEEVYQEAADEWRRAVSADENRATLERVRETLGKVTSRALVSGMERQNGIGDLQGHAIIAKYNTKFERGDAIETFTLVEREGHWLLARYAVETNALK